MSFPNDEQRRTWRSRSACRRAGRGRRDVVYGLNASADSFYGRGSRCQFRDCNGNVLERLRARGVASVEMESLLRRTCGARHAPRGGVRDRGGEQGHGRRRRKGAFEAVEAGGARLLRTVVALPADVPPPEPPARETDAELGSALAPSN